MLRIRDDKSETASAAGAVRALLMKPLLVRRCFGVAAALVGLTVMTLAWDGADDAVPVSRLEVGHPEQARRERVSASDPALQTFQRFALNLLVFPLVDDAEPPRWSRDAIDWICDGRGQVAVNGKPLVDGAPVPTTSFTVSWKLDHCAPLSGDPLLLDGEIVFAISPEDGHWRASIDAPTLSAQTLTGRRLPAIAPSSNDADRNAAEVAP